MSTEETLARLRAVVRAEGVDAEIVVRQISSDEEAAETGFFGSPTILVNGRDIAPPGPHEATHVDACRLYVRPDGRPSPLPPAELLREAVRSVGDHTAGP